MIIYNIYKRLLVLSCLLCYSLLLFAEFVENFSDGNYTDNPTWVGDYHNFGVNTYGQLQSKAIVAATSYLSTNSTVNSEAEWTFFCRIATTPTAYNNMRFYLISSEENPLIGNGWFVQIGGANKNITLCQQTNGEKEIMIANSLRKEILDMPDNKVWVRVRLSSGLFSLETKVERVDTAYVLEGEYIPQRVGESKYFSIVVRNSSKTGSYYYADDIIVRGESKQEIDEDISDDTVQDNTFLDKDGVYLARDYFSPNADGVDDNCIVYYTLPSAGFKPLIRIFTANGLLVRTLNDDILPTQGSIIWDGTTDTGNPVEIGVYVVFCEITNTQTGQILRAKLPVAVLL